MGQNFWHDLYAKAEKRDTQLQNNEKKEQKAR